MIFFNKWLDKYKKIKLQYMNFKIDKFSDFQNVISDSRPPPSPLPRASLWRIAYEIYDSPLHICVWLTP